MSEPSTQKGRGAWVCLPTYNEAENFCLMAEAILNSLPEAHILVVDDNSPDGTGQLADDYSKREPRVSVLHRSRKEGLGKAYLDGFTQILEKPDTEYVIQMDADGSHPTSALPAMLDALHEFDLAIGSRYIPGGGVENWGLIRRCISRFGSIYAQLWLGLPVKDPTGGFKAWRAPLLRQVLARNPGSGGYVFQVETSYAAHRLGASIHEVPILFVDRCIGHSKMTPGIALEAAWRVPAMRFCN